MDLPMLALHAYQAGPSYILPAIYGSFSRPQGSISAHGVGRYDSMGPLFLPTEEAGSSLIFTEFLIIEPCLGLFSWPRFLPSSHVSALRAYSSFRGCVPCVFLQEAF